ncbi:MAG: hydroxyacid dehydrogenase [Eubacteriales bacterium]|nr:hydroxyacid dehydrogenase [Eubacteriales bacterium]
MKIFLTEKIHENAVAFLKEHGEVVQGTSVKSEDILTQAADCDAILIRSAKITGEMMEQLPNLKVVAKHGIGVDNIDVEKASELGIYVVNAPFSNLNAVAEHSLALIMALSKNMVLLDTATRNGGFKKRNAYVNLELKGKTLGLVGFGRIAKMLAKKVSAMDMKVLASDPYGNPEDAKALNVTLCDMDTLIAESDFISVHVPLLPDTRHMCNAEFFGKMKNSAMLINASRGPVVDEEALYEALKNGVIAGAGLDVFEQEPPQDDNPLFDLDNVIVSPHNAALTDEALLAMAMDSAKGVVEVLEGQTPEFFVNRNTFKSK